MRGLVCAVAVVVLSSEVLKADVDVVSVAPTSSANEVTLTYDFSSDVTPLRDTSTLTCEQYAERKRINPTLTATPEPGGSSTQLTFKIPAESVQRADTVLCSVSSSAANSFRTTPKLSINVSPARQLAEAQKALRLRDDAAAQNYAPPRRVFFDRAELAPGRLTVYFRTPSFGSVRAHIKNGSTAPASDVGKEHKFEFDKLVEKAKYEVEAWVVDAAGNEVPNSKTDTDSQGRPLQFTIPANPGQVGMSEVNATAKSDSATIAIATDRDASMKVTAHKVIDRIQGKYGPNITADSPLVEGEHEFSVTLEKLDPQSEYEYVVTAVNAYGVENPSAPRTFTTPPKFDFREPIEVSLTPVGFLVTFDATDVPEAAGLRVKGKNFSRETSAPTPVAKKTTLSLNPEDTKEFLKSGDGQPTLEVYLKKNGSELTRQIKVAFEPIESAKKKIQSLSLDQTEKDRLSAAVDKVGKERWGSTWGNIIPEVFKLALKFIK